PDNTPPSADIAYPVSGNHDLTFPNHLVGRGIHTEAGGTGTYADPITFATSNTELTAGTEIYIPRFQKYFIGEDSCTECGQDMSGQRPNNPDGTIGPGPDGGPGLIHFDLWVGGGDADWPDVILCEDALTIYDGDNPHMEPIIVNPSPSEPVDQTPIFDPATGKCNTQPDGSSVALDSSLEVGPYENVPGPDGAPGSPNGTHLCMTDPGNSAAVGTKVTMEPCDATRADQNVSFSGAFLIFNNLCLDMGDGMGSPDPEDSGPARAITLQRCNLNANQQWELNTDGSISDIQSSNWALADQGNGVLTATYVADDGNSAYNYFAFPFLREKDATVPVTLDASSVPAGSTVTITGSGLTTPTAEATLIASGDSDGVSLGTVTAAADGTFSQAVTIPAGTAAGAYQVRIVGVADAAPDGTTITDQSQLQFGALANFRPVDRTVPITGVSSDLQVTAAVAPSSAPEPSAAAPAAPATASTGAGNGSWYEWLCAVMAIIGIVAVLIAVRRRLAQQTK
ncbi:MAG: ricin-type beta-trefoil lectin domain protein, partial [Actinomycetia bacterium]|nr:ricin-type beta-trefoil lectin domain protein [Actinomycetes bacterium]